MIIKVKFLKEGQPSGRAYTFFSNEVVAVGDIVQINESAKGVVTEVDVPESEIEAFKDKVKTIVGKVTSNTLGKIISIEEITGINLENVGNLNGSNGSQLGIGSMINSICGCGSYDGYRVKTEGHEFNILISNEQNCCEDWGYFQLNDDENEFVGAELLQVNLTDTALNKEKCDEEMPYELDAGGIQFVDFETNKGVLQLAVYNGHNGYYGHSIIIAKDEEIVLQDTL